MQALVDTILENKILTFAAAAIAALLAAALILVIFRLASGRRLKMPGDGRARLPRLGVVDSVDLDRQRQLVIVRRDNIEHLLMIGGPNDIVIESGIIRAEAREQRLRERELREREPKEAPQPQTPAAHHGLVPAPGPSPAASQQQPEVEPEASQPPRKGAALPIPPALSPEHDAVTPASGGSETALAPPALAAALSPPAPPLSSPAAPAQRTPTFPLSPRRTAQTLPPRPPREPLIRSDLAARGDGASPSGVFPRAPLSAPFRRSSPPRQLAETMAKPAGFASAPATSAPAAQPAEATARSEPAPKEVADPAATESSPALRPQPSNGPDGPSEPPAGAPVEPSAEAFAKSEAAGEESEAAAEKAAHMSAFETVDSLEEEMAKLLGRGLGR
jgi:flagellar protein FliO/FliZ